MQHDFAAVRPVAVLEKINPLPGAKRKPALPDRHADRNRSQGRFDMGRHIIRAFQRVGDPAHRGIVRRRHEAGEEHREIAPDIRIGIFLDKQRAGCVPDEDGQQAFIHAGLSHETRGLGCEFVEPLAMGGDGYCLLRHIFSFKQAGTKSSLPTLRHVKFYPITIEIKQ